MIDPSSLPPAGKTSAKCRSFRAHYHVSNRRFSDRFSVLLTLGANVNSPTRELRGEARVLPFLADRE